MLILAVHETPTATLRSTATVIFRTADSARLGEVVVSKAWPRECPDCRLPPRPVPWSAPPHEHRHFNPLAPPQLDVCIAFHHSPPRNV